MRRPLDRGGACVDAAGDFQFGTDDRFAVDFVLATDGCAGADGFGADE